MTRTRGAATHSSRTGLVFLALCLPILACQSVVVIETAEGTIRAYDEQIAARGAEVVLQQGPVIQEILSTSGGPPRVELGLWRFSHAHPDAEGYTLDSGIVIRVLGEEWSFTLAHELVHWHATGYWDTLPTIIEEGLACLMSYAVGGIPTVHFESPTQEFIDAALSCSSKQYLALPPGEYRTRLIEAGLWVVAIIGMEQLNGLARRADERGLSEVPRAWFLELFPPTRINMEFDRASVFPGTEWPPRTWRGSL